MSENILILAPHTDDGEIGMGGTIARFIEDGLNVHYAAFSTADKSLPKEFPPDTLLIEVMEATKELGIPEENVHVYPYEVRTFSYYRQEILEDLVKLKSTIKPDRVFSPTTRDLHQDHIVISHEGIRAFKKTNLFAYELPWNNINFNTDGFFELNDHHVETKIQVLAKYKSQATKDYMQPQFIRSLAQIRGVQIGVKYAEAFEIIRWISKL
ncbi:MAG: PIG-L deacetylase family protein [Candidatus Kariarchaeaceae archaeon]